MVPEFSSIGARTAAAVGPIERRLHRRYPVQYDLRYKLSRRDKLVLHGFGKTVDISSGGLFFMADQILPTGVDIELSMDWPVQLEGGCPLQLRILGHIVRRGGEGFAVKINRTEFRTRGAQAVPLGAAAAPVCKVKVISSPPSGNARTPDEVAAARARSA